MSKFVVSKCQLQWWIPLEVSASPKWKNHLKLRQEPFGSPKLYFDNFPQLKRLVPTFYDYDPNLREQVKATIRKRSGIKGNIKSPFNKWRDSQINFEIIVAHFPPDGFVLVCRTNIIVNKLKADDLIALSILPTVRNSQLRQAIEKMAKYISTGDIYSKSRPIESLPSFLPIITCYQFTPRDKDRSIYENVPWHVITSIATRHRNLRPDNNNLVPNFKNRNYSFRDDICVISKQSLLIISDSSELEHGGMRYSTFIAYRARELLRKESHRVGPADLNFGPFIESLRYAYEFPVVISDSSSFQHAWAHAFDGLQLVKFIKSLEVSLSDELASYETLDASIAKISELDKQKGASSQDAGKLLQLKDIDIRLAWNYVRTKLEQIILWALADLNVEPMAKPTLNPLIELLKKHTNLPEDVLASAELIRGFGNIGSHAAPIVYRPNEVTLAIVIYGLAYIADWYMTLFKSSLTIQCTNTSCGAMQSIHQKFCSQCGSAILHNNKLVCHRCKREVDNNMIFCGNCGVSLNQVDPS